MSSRPSTPFCLLLATLIVAKHQELARVTQLVSGRARILIQAVGSRLNAVLHYSASPAPMSLCLL